jgi:hypothetical protein
MYVCDVEQRLPSQTGNTTAGIVVEYFVDLARAKHYHYRIMGSCSRYGSMMAAIRN